MQYFQHLILMYTGVQIHCQYTGMIETVFQLFGHVIPSMKYHARYLGRRIFVVIRFSHDSITVYSIIITSMVYKYV